MTEIESSGTFSTHSPVGAVFKTAVRSQETYQRFRDAHTDSDVDAEVGSQHHTLGFGNTQALPGSAYEALKAEIVAATAASILIGEVKIWLDKDFIPNSFMMLKGANISRATYPELFALWGTQYGAGDGFTTFGTPDPRYRKIMGTDAMSNIGQTDGNVIGVRDNFNFHPHTHTISGHATSTDAGSATGSSTVSHDHTGNSGSDGIHSHSISTAGGHSHGGTNTFTHSSASNTGSGAGLDRLIGPAGHSHGISTDGGHDHGGTGNSASHNHSISVGTTTAATAHSHTGDSHSHSIGTLGTNSALDVLWHPFMYVGLIVRYTADLTKPGVS